LNTNVKSDLRSALQTCVKEMTVAAGYNYTYTRVFTNPKNMEEFDEFPAVNILFGNEQRQGTTHQINNAGKFTILLPVQFDVFLNDSNNITLARDKVLADFQKYFGLNYYVKPSTSERTVFEMVWLGDVEWGTEVQKPNGGISIDFELYYTIRRNNPNLMI
jgi:hypothetical protein